jgi:hypothetical protein
MKDDRITSYTFDEVKEILKTGLETSRNNRGI